MKDATAKISAHVSTGMICAYADGTLGAGMSLLVASHLTFCPCCRSRVARIECLCGALMAEMPPVPSGCLETTLARLDETGDGTEPASDPPCAAPLPRPLRRRLGGDPDRLDWRYRLPGLRECRLEGFPGERVSLLRARAGTRIPRHRHKGREAALILDGAMLDGARRYRRGDVVLADARNEHAPAIPDDTDCLCLMVLAGALRFTGPLGRLLPPVGP